MSCYKVFKFFILSMWLTFLVIPSVIIAATAEPSPTPSPSPVADASGECPSNAYHRPNGDLVSIRSRRVCGLCRPELTITTRHLGCDDDGDGRADRQQRFALVDRLEEGWGGVTINGRCEQYLMYEYLDYLTPLVDCSKPGSAAFSGSLDYSFGSIFQACVIDNTLYNPLTQWTLRGYRTFSVGDSWSSEEIPEIRQDFELPSSDNICQRPHTGLQTLYD